MRLISFEAPSVEQSNPLRLLDTGQMDCGHFRDDSKDPTMKIICHREGLLSACQLVSVAVAARNVNPVLQNFKVMAEGDRCTLMATDTEVGIRMEVRSVNVEEPGEALVPASRVLSILREATDDELTIDASSDACTLVGRHMEYEMPGEDPTIFPDFPTFAEDRYHEISSGVLRDMIRRQDSPREVVDLRKSIEDVLDLLHSELLHRHIQTGFSATGTCRTVANQAQLQQCILALDFVIVLWDFALILKHHQRGLVLGANALHAPVDDIFRLKKFDDSARLVFDTGGPPVNSEEIHKQPAAALTDKFAHYTL